MTDLTQALVVPRMTITESFDSENEFSILLRRSHFPVVNINRLIQHEGIESAQILGQTRLKDLESSLLSIHCLFGRNITAHARIYFVPITIQRLKALSAYIKGCMDALRID